MCPSPPSSGSAKRHAASTEPARPAGPPWIEASGLVLQRGGQPVLQGLSLSIGPGLTLVRGGEQRGKTSLLQLLAGEIAPDAGVLRLRTPRVFRADHRSPADDALTVTQWWQQALARHGMQGLAMDRTLAAELCDAWGLSEHLHKQMHMLSTGSRRKAAYVLAFAAPFDVALLDVPMASLDASSCGVLCELLAEAAQHPARAWVVADYAGLPGLGAPDYAQVIELGDAPA
ncbi:MAG: ATP-binding cassette domain-containing protein [Burkholderiaceae bacterium]